MNINQLLAISQMLEAFATVTAVIFGGAWALSMFLQKRQRFPSVKINHQLTYRKVTDNFILLSINICLINSSNVLLKLDHWTIMIKQLLPPQAELQRMITNRAVTNKGLEIIEWHVLVNKTTNDVFDQHEVEPHDQAHFHYEFLIPANVKAILLESYFENVKKKNRQIGWRFASEHDLKSGVKNEQKQIVKQANTFWTGTDGTS